MGFKVPFVDVPTHFHSMQDPVLQAIKRVLSSGDIILRKDVHQFEKDFAAMIGVEHAVGINSGTDAVHFALRAIGLKPGDEVITVCHSCVATLAGIVHAGGTPVLVDVRDDFNIAPAAFEAAITEHTRAVVPVHLNGHACDMEAIMAIAQRHGLTVMEDCAQAIGAKYDGRSVGTFGAAAAFSLYPFKMLGAFGDAGCVATDDAEIAKKVSVLRDYGQDRETGEVLYYGYNSRLDNLQAAVLNVKMGRFPEAIRRRRQVAETYRRGLADLPGVRLPHFDDGKYFDVFMNYTICVADRDDLVRHLKESGVEVLTPISLAKPLHRQPALRLPPYDLPNTDRIAGEFIYLPAHPEMSDRQVEYVIQAIWKYYE